MLLSADMAVYCDNIESCRLWRNFSDYSVSEVASVRKASAQTAALLTSFPDPVYAGPQFYIPLSASEVAISLDSQF